MIYKKIWKPILTGVLIAMGAGLVFFLARHFLGDRISHYIAEILATSVLLLCKLMIYIFVIGGILMVLLIHWVGWENFTFKLKQMHYHSALIAKDYYKEYKRISYEKFMGPVTRFEKRGLEAGGPLIDEKLAADGTLAGRAALKGGQVTYKDGKVSGVVETYHAGGGLASEISYVDGRYEGFYRTYYPSGRLHNEKFYKAGKLDGPFKAWDEDGSLFFEINYKDDKQHGTDKVYYRTGILQYEDIYVGGKKVTRRTYDESGKLKFVQNYQ